MKTKFLMLLFVSIFILSACADKGIDPPQQDTAGLQKELDDRLEEIMADKEPGEELTDIEKTELDMYQADIDDAEEKNQQAEYDLVNNLIDLEDKKREGTAARGSCSAIDKSSTCLEYIGSFWTEQQMKFNCSESGTFSLKPCEEGALGGCNTGTGLMTDTIAWFYGRGAEAFDADDIKSASNACNANPLGRWISAK